MSKPISTESLAPLREVLACDYYNIPYYVNRPLIDPPPDKESTSLATLVNSRVVFLEKIAGTIFSFTPHGCWTPIKADEAERKIVFNMWENVKHLLMEGLEYVGVLALFARKQYYSRLPSYAFLHTIYDQDTQKIFSFSDTRRLSKNIGIPTVPLLLSLQMERPIYTEFAQIVREISSSDSNFSRNNIQGMVIRREGTFMALSGEHFMGQVNGRYCYDNPLYKFTNSTKNGLA